MSKRIITAMLAILLAFGLPGIAGAASDDPTPYTLTADGIQLPPGTTFPAHGHVNVRWEGGGHAGVHFDPNNGQPGGVWIGQSLIPWSAFGIPADSCITWVQLSMYSEHYGEGGQEPFCLGKEEPWPTEPSSPPEPTSPEPSPTPTPTWDPTPTPSESEPSSSPSPTSPSQQPSPRPSTTSGPPSPEPSDTGTSPASPTTTPTSTPAPSLTSPPSSPSSRPAASTPETSASPTSAGTWLASTGGSDVKAGLFFAVSLLLLGGLVLWTSWWQNRNKP